MVLGAKRLGYRGETTRIENRGETTRGETTWGETSWGRNVLLPSSLVQILTPQVRYLYLTWTLIVDCYILCLVLVQSRETGIYLENVPI